MTQSQPISRYESLIDWFRHIESLLPKGVLDSAWELLHDGEWAIALDSATDKLERLTRPLNDQEITELTTLLQAYNIEDVDGCIHWVKKQGKGDMSQ